MPAFTGVLAAFAHDRYGVVGDGELRDLGVSVDQRRVMVSNGVLARLLDGVYRVTSTPESVEGWARAVCLSDERTYVTGRAGGRLWNVRRMGAIDRIEVRAPHFVNTLDHPKILLRRCGVLDPVDVVTRADGIRVASPPRLLFDLAASLDDLDLESVVEQVLDRRWCVMPTLHATARRLCRPGRAGSARFARVVSARDEWLKPADSHEEVVLFDALRSAGVDRLERQHRLVLPGGQPIHVDIAVPALRWAIEVDHVEWHGGRVATQRDKARDRGVRRLGWQPDRVTDAEIRHGLGALVAELVDLHADLLAGAVRPLRSVS